jgi:hypothetical protein
MKILPELADRLPESIKDRLLDVENEVQQVIAKGRGVLATELSGPIAFHYEHGAPSDLLTPYERAQSISFITRFGQLPSAERIDLRDESGQWYIANLASLRHVLNEFRPVIQNQSDSVHYTRLHQVWYPMFLRKNSAEGMTVRAVDAEARDVTPIFAKWIGERNRAIRIILEQLDYDYVFNGVLAHADSMYSARFLDDYVSGRFNYVLLRHAGPLDFIKDCLEPYFWLIAALTFPKLGAL